MAVSSLFHNRMQDDCLMNHKVFPYFESVQSLHCSITSFVKPATSAAVLAPFPIQHRPARRLCPYSCNHLSGIVTIFASDTYQRKLSSLATLSLHLQSMSSNSDVQVPMFGSSLVSFLQVGLFRPSSFHVASIPPYLHQDNLQHRPRYTQHAGSSRYLQRTLNLCVFVIPWERRFSCSYLQK